LLLLLRYFFELTDNYLWPRKGLKQNRLCWCCGKQRYSWPRDWIFKKYLLIWGLLHKVITGGIRLAGQS